MTHKTEAEVAEEYNITGDLSEFDEVVSEPVQVRRNVTISVRFSDDEIAELRRKADDAGVKVTALIRDAAIGTTGATTEQIAKLVELRKAAVAIERDAHRLAALAEK